MTEVITALIGAGVAIVVCIINNHFTMGRTLAEIRENNDKAIQEVRLSNNDVIAHLQTTISVLEIKLSQLAEKTDKHNNLVERMYDLEKLATQYSIVQQNMDKRVDDIREELNRKWANEAK